MAVNGDAQWLTSSSWDGSVHVWDLAPMRLYAAKKKNEDRKAINAKYASPGYVPPVVDAMRRRSQSMNAGKGAAGDREGLVHDRLSFEQVCLLGCMRVYVYM